LKIKILNDLFIIDLLAAILVLVVTFLPSSAIRILLGLPCILFLPGYTLLAAVFTKDQNMGGLERLALSISLSIALVALIGLGLNFTSWGIRLIPVLYSITIFIILASTTALIRRARLFKHVNWFVEIQFKLPDYGRRITVKPFTVILAGVLLLALITLGYTAAAFPQDEKFTEFYILGLNGQARDYPTEFVMDTDTVISVVYGNGSIETADARGRLIIGIVNHQQQPTSYSVDLLMDGDPIDIFYKEQTLKDLDNIELAQNEKWEQEIEFAPQQPGSRQSLEIRLKDSNSSIINSLRMWIDVKGQN
jgi:uncharacterized membrane protein